MLSLVAYRDSSADSNNASPTYPGTMTVGNSSNSVSDGDAIGSILEMAVQKSPLIYIEKG